MERDAPSLLRLETVGFTSSLFFHDSVSVHVPGGVILIICSGSVVRAVLVGKLFKDVCRNRCSHTYMSGAHPVFEYSKPT